MYDAAITIINEYIDKYLFSPSFSWPKYEFKKRSYQQWAAYEICDRIMLAGYHLYYEERLVFQHYMPNERLTDTYHHRLLQGFEQMYGQLEHYSAAIVYGRMTRWQLLQESCRRLGSVLLRHNGRSLYKLKVFLIHGLGLMCLADDIAKQIRNVQKIMK